METAQWSEGADGTSPRHVERLWPGALTWLLAVGVVGALTIAYAAAVGPAAGLAVLAGCGVLAATVLIGWAPVVCVDDRVVRVGRARLPLSCCGRVIELDAAGTRLARGPGGDPTAFIVTRPGVGPGSVLIEVVDPSDPHATWLIASRHPGRLANAIRAAREDLAGTADVG